MIENLLPLMIERALLVFCTVWFVNAVNFLDGLDWITAAQVVPMTLGIAVLQALGAVPASIGFLALVLLGATLGFAPFNKHPAKVFLGDAGSLPIGLLLAFMLIYVAGTDLAAALRREVLADCRKIQDRHRHTGLAEAGSVPHHQRRLAHLPGVEDKGAFTRFQRGQQIGIRLPRDIGGGVYGDRTAGDEKRGGISALVP